MQSVYIFIEGVYLCNFALSQGNIMYYRRIETNAAARASNDASLKVNAKERLAANAAQRKRNKGQGRAIIAPVHVD